jgi:hypothetical protein
MVEEDLTIPYHSIGSAHKQSVDGWFRRVDAAAKLIIDH